MHEPRRTVAPASDCALEWCTSASKAVRTSSGCTPERLRPLRPRAASRAGYAACIYFCKTAAAVFGAALSSCSKAARTKRSLTSERCGSCKACAKDSCRNFIPKSIFEILLHKISKFSTRLNFKILTKPDSKLRRSRIMKFYPAKF